MFKTLLKYLRNEGGWMAAIPLVMSMVNMGMGIASKKKAQKAFSQSGEEKNLQNYTQSLWGPRGTITAPMDEGRAYINKGLGAAEQGGLFGAIQDAFNPNPTTTELQGVTGQQRQALNEARNMGVRGGQLKTAMMNINQNAARNRLGLMEAARQSAAQRGFQALSGMLPSQQSDIARGNQMFNYDQLMNMNWTNLAKMMNEKRLAQAGVLSKSSESSGSGAGGLLGGLMGMFGTGTGGGLGGSVGGGSPSIMGSGGWGGFDPNTFNIPGMSS